MDTRVMNTEELLAAIRHGIDLDLNRQANIDEVKKSIDPDGQHVLLMLLPFHSSFRDLPDHHRVEVYMKVVDSMEPAVFVLDVVNSRWQAARPAKSFVDF